MVRQWQSLFFDGRHSETILDDNPDFVMLWKPSISGQNRRRKEEVEPALKEMLESKTGLPTSCSYRWRRERMATSTASASNSDMLENT